MAERSSPYDTSRVRELLKHKRKTRGIRSCFPCRHRKVRCDGQVPCSSCVNRDHPELCRVPTSSAQQQREEEPAAHSGLLQQGHTNDANLAVPRSSEESPSFSSNPAAIISRLERIEEQISSLKADLCATAAATSTDAASILPIPDPLSSRQLYGPNAQLPLNSKSPGRHVLEDATGATIFLGSHSDNPLALGCREASESGDLMVDGAIINQFVPRTYPFTSLWEPSATIKQVCLTLPDDSDMIRYWHAYRSTAYPFYPVLVDVDEFGRSLFTFLNQRSYTEAANNQETEPDPSWIALLFAVMACGVQFTDDPAKERDLRSKVFTCSSFHCLRLSNFFNHTNLYQIQAMALIGHCLRNNLDTNSAWILMGATIRLAQSIGLHESSPSLQPAEQLQRTWLWWTLVWQDTFLSFTYDRPSSCSITKTCPIPYAGKTSGLSFPECIFKICHIILDETRLETTGSQDTQAHDIRDCEQQLEGVWVTAAQFLTSKANCSSLQDHLERLALGIHLGYTICHINLVYLDSSLTKDPLTTAPSECRRWAILVVEYFLELHRFSPAVCRSWAFVHNAVSCAITLHRLSDIPSASFTPSEAKELAQRLITVFSQEARKSEWYDADTNVRYFGPYSRSLKALKQTYNDFN